jgi:hypothetical protein
MLPYRMALHLLNYEITQLPNSSVASVVNFPTKKREMNNISRLTSFTGGVNLLGRS